MHLDSAVRDCRVFVKQWSSAAHSLGYLLQYSKKLSTTTNNLLQAVQQAWSLHNSYRPPDALLKQLQRYAWLPSMCEAAMSLKDCCSRQWYSASDPGQYSDAMEHADTAILALGSLLLAVLRWCNLSQLMHTAQQQGAPKGAAAFRELFEQVWCHAGVFLLANYTAVLVALLRQEVETQQQQQQQQSSGHSFVRSQRQGHNNPNMSAVQQSPHQQQQEQQLSLDELPQQPAAQQQQEQQSQSPVAPEYQQHSQLYMPPSPKQQQLKPLARPPVASPSRHGRQSSTPNHPNQQQHELPVLQLSMPSVWRTVQLPATHRVWGPPRELALWHRQGYGVIHSAAAELQLLLMLWGWAIRMAPTLGLQHHASADVVLLLLEAAWLLDVCPAAASHQKRGLCLWHTPVLMLQLLAQPVLPADDEQDEAAAATPAAKAGANENHSKPSKGTGTEQLLQQPRECSRKVLQQMLLFENQVKECLEQWRTNVGESQETVLKAVAEQSASHIVANAGLTQCHGSVINEGEQRQAETAKLLQTTVLDCMPQAVQWLTTAATAAQPFTAAELQLLDRQLASCLDGAARFEAHGVYVPEQAIHQMQTILGALYQRFGQQKADVLRILQHPSMAGSLVQLPLQLLQHLQPLTDVQLKQAAVHFSRLDDTIRKLVELPTILLQAEQGLQAELQQAQQLQQQQEQQQKQHEGVWCQLTSQLLQLAEAYLRCQHLSRVVGLESGQLLAAVVPKSARQLLHVLSSRRLVAGLAALVISRCKALQVLLAETLEQQQVAIDAAAYAAGAVPGGNHQEMPAGWSQMCSERPQARKAKQDVSDSSSSDSSSSDSCSSDRAGLQCHKQRTGYDSGSDDDVESNFSDDDSVSISSWCSSSSSIMESPGVLLHEKHLAIGSMAVHILEQAVTWLQIIAIWQTYPAEQKAACLLSAHAIAQLLDEAATHQPGDWRHKTFCTESAASHFASLMATSSVSSNLNSSTVSDNAGNTSSTEATKQVTLGLDASAAVATEGSDGAAASTVAAAFGACGTSAAAGSGAALMDSLASTLLPMACCMIQSAARALQRLLPVWQQIAPATAASTAATAAGASNSGSMHGGAESDTDSVSGSDSGSEDEALPSLKDIASWHQLLANQSLMPVVVSVLTVLPSITAALHQQQQLEQQHSSGVELSADAFNNAVDTFTMAMGYEDTATCAAAGSAGIPMVAAVAVQHATEQVNGGMLADATRSAAISMLSLLPFQYREVLQASTMGDVTEAAAGLLAFAAAGSAAVGAPAAAGSSQYTANSPSSGFCSSSSSCAVMAKATLDDASDRGAQAAAYTAAAVHAAAATAHSSKSSHNSGVSSPPPSSRLQQPSPRSSSSGSRYWGCNNAQCLNLSSASELTMPVYGCSACRSAGYTCTYCSAACQQSDWPVHKAVCKARRRLMTGSKQLI